MNEPVWVIAGRYRVVDRIGSGGMADVVRAHDEMLDRDVAVKVFRSVPSTPDTASGVERQRAELHALARLNHPNLTILYDGSIAGQQGPAYLVMELIDGPSLAQVVERGPLGEPQVRRVGAQIADALAYVHAAGMVHRDVKPANILLGSDATSGSGDAAGAATIRARLTDFGIVRLVGSEPVTQTDMTLGSASYLAPEQARGSAVGPPADVYALGLTLIEALTARTAFPGSVEDSAFARLDRDPELPQDLPSPLARVLTAMTARDPAARPAPMEVAIALQDAFVEDLVRARRVDSDVLADTEPERVAAVRRYNLLDVDPGDGIVRVARLARRVLGVPVAGVSVVDAEREWFAALSGEEAHQVERNTTLAAESIASGAPWTAADVRGDPRAEGHPLLVARPDLASYASVPLTTFDGHTIGVVSVFGPEGREFGEQDLADLEDLAAITVRELELRLVGRGAIFDR